MPFYAYQAKIISFAVVAYVCLFVNADRHRSAVPAAIKTPGVTVLGQSAVDSSDALGAVLNDRSARAYWIQTGVVAAYFGLLFGMQVFGERASQRPE